MTSRFCDSLTSMKSIMHSIMRFLTFSKKIATFFRIISLSKTVRQRIPRIFAQKSDNCVETF